MEVILLERVKDQGEKGDIVDVSPGYARNFLIPNNKAKPATDEAVAEIKQEQKKQKQQRRKKEQKAKQKYSKLNDSTLTINKSANNEGSLYASVNKGTISETIKEFCGLKVDTDQIHVDKDIKSTGKHNIEVKLADGSTAQVQLNIQSK